MCSSHREDSSSQCSCCSLCGVEASWAFPSPVKMSIVVILVQVTFRQSCWYDFMNVSSDNARRHNFTANSLAFCFLFFFSGFFPNLFIPSFTMFHELFRRCIHWEWILQSCILIACGFLAEPPSVAKGSLLDEG